MITKEFAVQLHFPNLPSCLVKLPQFTHIAPDFRLHPPVCLAATLGLNDQALANGIQEVLGESQEDFLKGADPTKRHLILSLCLSSFRCATWM